ncbi:restriction endonuclease subunit S [Pseudomonas aeruginosa]|uniref:restriction endonuclease subunit S n=1 Tax=Pseudomonas aeruginosa TaxID=287 RepID=UPI000FD2CA10|nr:restriction endonuclease subunit S [Pseudomonas aeruginosa]RUH99056.1 restriction endonuclease subunit S [Pseudomonas aeruginosa]
MSGNEKRPLVPRLRFPEFRDAGEWQNPTLGEISEPVEERVGNRKLTPVSISAGIGFVPQAEKFGRDISGNQYKLYTLVRDGDFVYNKGNSLKFPQGCVYDLRGWGEVAAPNVFICFRLKCGYENGFYRQCFEKNSHGVQLRKHITSGARSNGLLNISKDAFFSVRIPVPDHAEQQKIADCLSSLDELITAETQKLDALKTHKKGLMQQLFPCKGEAVPRLRAPEFQEAGPWEVKPFERLVVKSFYGTSSSTSDTGKYPVLRMGNMVDGGLKFSNLAYIDLDVDSFSKIRLARGDILLNRTNSLDLVGKISIFDRDVECITASYIVTYRLDKKQIIPEFCNFMLNTPQYQKKIRALARPSISQANINPTTFKNELTIPLPCIAEQQWIVSCFSFLDEQIAVQTQKVETLKTHKKGLMQQLFPVLDEVSA